MTLSPGQRLGPYEIVAPLGAGGMGEVYRAKDARLQREVAIKVLPAEVASQVERLKRFEKEARAASALNHPNLVTIYDIGSADGVEYIAMELVDGRTLREVLAAGPVPMRSLLSFAAQASDGLAKAHGAGIVHRDLKPENVMITKDGFLKILDFGLAKLTEPEGAREVTSSPTMSGATEPGVVLGTAGYMSPEQALGKPLDFRSDQFSLGSILYEMATGKRAFQRGSTPETLTAIIRDEPEAIASLAPLAPAPLRWVVDRCLAKAPDDRYASTRDLARDLATLKDRLSETSGGTGVTRPAVPARRNARRAVPWAIVAALAAGLAWALIAGRSRPLAAARAMRFSVSLPDGVGFQSEEIEGQSALSPDGRQIALVGTASGRKRIYLRALDSLEVRPLEGTEGGVSPFWSPDSRSLGFFADGKLQRMDLSGGPPRTICDAPYLETLASWGSAGAILFSQLGPQGAGIHLVSAEGGQPRRVILKDRPGSTGVWPRFLPDGRRFLFLSRNFEAKGDRRWYLNAGAIDSPEITPISDAIWSRVEYVAPGYLIYASQGALLARPFDERTLRFSGEAITLAERVYYFNGPAQAGFSASQVGVVSWEKLRSPSRVAWLDRSGREVEPVGLEGIVGSLRLSPDGRTVAASVRDEKLGTSDIWLYELARKLAMRLTLDEEDEQAPVWSADGTKIFFRGDRFGPPDLFEIRAGSPGAGSTLLRRVGVQHPEATSPDGRYLAFTEWNRQTDKNLWLLPLTVKGDPVPLAQTPSFEAGARFSPDGRWVAFVSNESGAREIYLMPVDGGGERIRISSGGGAMPRWRRDGRELFFLADGGWLAAVAVRPGASPDPGTPSLLFPLQGEVRDYDVALDGERFLIDVAPGDPAPIGVLVDWPALVPGRAR